MRITKIKLVISQIGFNPGISGSRDPGTGLGFHGTKSRGIHGRDPVQSRQGHPGPLGAIGDPTFDRIKNLTPLS